MAGVALLEWLIRYRTDLGYRTRVSLYLSLAIHLSYAGFKLVSGIVYRSFWFDAFAVYYLLLAAIRFMLVYHLGASQRSLELELRRYRLCGIGLLVLNLALSGVVIHMMVKKSAPAYGDTVIAVMVLYALYAVTASVADLIRLRRYARLSVQAAKIIRFTAAGVSLLSVGATLMDRFCGAWPMRGAVIGIGGLGICLLVLGLSLHMIRFANQALKKRKRE